MQFLLYDALHDNLQSFDVTAPPVLQDDTFGLRYFLATRSQMLSHWWKEVYWMRLLML
jgi:hypothetical protein